MVNGMPRTGFHYNLGSYRGPDKIGSRAGSGRVLHVVDVNDVNDENDHAPIFLLSLIEICIVCVIDLICSIFVSVPFTGTHWDALQDW